MSEALFTPQMTYVILGSISMISIVGVVICMIVIFISWKNKKKSVHSKTDNINNKKESENE